MAGRYSKDTKNSVSEPHGSEFSTESSFLFFCITSFITKYNSNEGGYNMSKIKIYVRSILLPLLTGSIISIIISGSIDYNNLIQPPLSPPALLFPIVWTILYTLMGVSDGLLTTNSLHDDTSKFVYYLQLVVNALWSIIFFRLKWRFFAFLWIIGLAILIMKMIAEFYKKNKLSAFLQIPYLLWTIFATYLNFATWFLNK